MAGRKSSCYRSSAKPRVHTKCVSVTVYIVFAGFQFSTIFELCHLARVLKHNLGGYEISFSLFGIISVAGCFISRACYGLDGSLIANGANTA